MLILCRNTFSVITIVLCLAQLTLTQRNRNRRVRPRVPSFSEILNDAVSLERAASKFDRAIQSGDQQAARNTATENIRVQVIPDQADSPFTPSDHSTDSASHRGHRHSHNNNAPVITDIAGNVPPNPSGFHIDLPGEHGNTHDFPVIHRDSSPISGDSHSHSHSDTRPPPNQTPSGNGPPFEVPVGGSIGPSLVDIKTLNDEFSGVSVFQTPPESIAGQINPVDLGSTRPDPSPLFPSNSIPPNNKGDFSNPNLPSPVLDLGLGPIVLGSVPVDPFGEPITGSNPIVPVDVSIPADVGDKHKDHVDPNQDSHTHGGHKPTNIEPPHGHSRPNDHHGAHKEVPILPNNPTKVDRRKTRKHHESNVLGPSIPSIIGPAPPLEGVGSSAGSGVFSGPHPVGVHVDPPVSRGPSHGAPPISDTNNPSFGPHPVGIHVDPSVPRGPSHGVPPISDTNNPSVGNIHTPNVLGPVGFPPSPRDNGIQIATGPMTPPPGLDISNFGPDIVPNQPPLPVVPIGVVPGADNVPAPGRENGGGRDWRERRRRWRDRRMRRRRNRRRRLRPAKEPVDVVLGKPFDPVSEPTDIIPQPGLPPHHSSIDIHHGKDVHNEPISIPEIAHPEPTIDLHSPRRPEHNHVHPEPEPLPHEKSFRDNHGVTVHREPGHDGVRPGLGYEGRRPGARGGLLGEIMRDAAHIRNGGVLNGPPGSKGLISRDYGRDRNNQVHITRSGPIPTNPSPNRQGARIVISHRNVGNQLTQRLGNTIFNLLGRVLG